MTESTMDRLKKLAATLILMGSASAMHRGSSSLQSGLVLTEERRGTASDTSNLPYAFLGYTVHNAPVGEQTLRTFFPLVSVFIEIPNMRDQGFFEIVSKSEFMEEGRIYTNKITIGGVRNGANVRIIVIIANVEQEVSSAESTETEELVLIYKEGQWVGANNKPHPRYNNIVGDHTIFCMCNTDNLRGWKACARDGFVTRDMTDEEYASVVQFFHC